MRPLGVCKAKSIGIKKQPLKAVFHITDETQFPFVGAGLLAKASCQATSILTVPPPSRASPLPQGIFGVFRSVYSPR
ncbi:hypothetical protein C5612_18940 [Pseudomonas frederiksbergensis]|uniref:Uncharacterized protein n=1 Tax=Pseudomonas frederiksbergensis TaxID=104087 RepID=A0A2S8HJI2_9PSED|nr:hypothetical protein C5612_18940 [Pseudomonas frederiksbergensis]